MEFYCKSGERIHVDILGKGFPIVFLHGNNLQSGYFAKQRVLRKEFQLLFVDSLGHGKSGELQGETSFAYLADSLEELLSSLSIKKCLLVGHSDGANLALEYAGRHGERVAGVPKLLPLSRPLQVRLHTRRQMHRQSPATDDGAHGLHLRRKPPHGLQGSRRRGHH